jgi:hypothetical protein
MIFYNRTDRTPILNLYSNLKLHSRYKNSVLPVRFNFMRESRLIVVTKHQYFQWKTTYTLISIGKLTSNSSRTNFLNAIQTTVFIKSLSVEGYACQYLKLNGLTNK